MAERRMHVELLALITVTNSAVRVAYWVINKNKHEYMTAVVCMMAVWQGNLQWMLVWQVLV